MLERKTALRGAGKTWRRRLAKAQHMVLVAGSLLLTTFCVVVLNRNPRANLRYTRNSEEELLRVSYAELLHRLRGPLSADDPQVVSELFTRHLLPPSTLPYNLTGSSDQGIRKFSWPFIHKYVKHFFREQMLGFFVEAGALNGELLSNTLWLEQRNSWTGLLVEPTAVTFRYLVWKRRRAWTSNTCLSITTYPRQAVFEATTQNKGDIAYPWFYRAENFEINPVGAGNFDWLLGSWNQAYTVAQCFPLWSYLLALNVTTVDFLSLDTQGGEWDILKTIPFDKVKVRAMVVEHYIKRQQGKYDPSFVSYMEDVGYHLVDCDEDPNYFFILKSDAKLYQKLKLLNDTDIGVSCMKK
ncbi:uncharacterized protein LOC122258770 [Penaeus japonicus]|uniref:uncharacterized protein LOC122258770 n=1 Tax=Penaeus japonicus TaxID=27405 RepID=UPI001C70B0B3|nr:uncharacterized protein LOC122258770 [Penaeus japonicus]